MPDTKTHQRLLRIKRNIEIKMEREVMHLQAIQAELDKKEQNIAVLQSYIKQYENGLSNSNARNIQHLVNQQAFIHQLGNAVSKEQDSQKDLLEQKNKCSHTIQGYRQHLERLEEVIHNNRQSIQHEKDKQREQIELDQWNQQKQQPHKPLP